MKAEQKAASDAMLVAFGELRAAEKQLKTTVGKEMDIAAMACQQAKSKRKLAIDANSKANATSEFALNFYVNSLTNSTSIIETDTPNNTAK